MLLRPCLPLRRALGPLSRRCLQTARVSSVAAHRRAALCGERPTRALLPARIPATAACRRGYAASQDLPPHREVVLPALSPTMETGSIVTWEKAEGDAVAEGDLLAEIETDKASMGFENEEAGYLAKIVVPAGTKDIPLGKLLCIIVENKEDVAKFKDFVDTSSPAAPAPTAAPAPAAAPAPSAPSTPAPPAAPVSAPTPAPATAPMPTGGRIMASPRARKLAAERGIDLSTVQPGSDGLVRAAHVPASAPVAVPAAPTPTPTAQAAAQHGQQEITDARRSTAQRVLLSKQTIPHYYLTIDIDLTRLAEVRGDVNAAAGKDGPQLSFNDFVIKAAALACIKVPAANSSWMETFIRQYESVDMCVSVSTEQGSVAPIVTGVERRGVADISRTVRELAERARQYQLQPHEVQGGTFSISNVGRFGVKSFSAILTPPQACHLTVGGVSRRLVPGSEGPRAVETMTVTLSCDHRVVDGAVGAQWLAAFRGYMEQPVSMIL